MPPDGSYRHWWFVIKQEFRDTEQFWGELREYYRVRPEELNRKLGPLDAEKSSPVFSRRMQKNVNLQDLQIALADEVTQRVEELKKEKDVINQKLVDIGDSLLKQGLQLTDNHDYQTLYRQHQEITDCIEQANKILERFCERAHSLEEEADRTLNKSVVDIKGCPELITRHHEKIIGRLVDLNLEIGEVRKRQQTLERELIKRLKDVEEAKAFRSKLEQLEKEQILEDYQDENRRSVERRDRKQFYEELGSLSENTSFIQRQIEEQKRQIGYYLDNLKSLAPYTNYATSVLDHIRRKKKGKEELRDLKNEVYKLKLFLSRKERKYDEFFAGVAREIKELRGDVSKSILETSALLDRCMDVWRKRWHAEGVPLLEETFDRNGRVVSAFAPIPAVQIVKIGKLKEKLLGEMQDRQREWNRVFGEIKREFREINYELQTPATPELDQKYFDRLDEASLTLSRSTQELIFLPDAQFKLSNFSDERIGLNPKTQNDDDFLVIDQVWETLTPEQEKELQKRLSRDKADGVEEAREFLLNEQLRRIENRFPVKKDAMEISTREFTEDETRAKYREIESHSLKLWNSDHYLIQNSRGDFKEMLYDITRKLFSNRSVRVVNNSVEFTDTGFVKDGHTEILSAKDYFIKSDDKRAFDGAGDELDLSDPASTPGEPDENMVELLSDPTYVSHAREREEKLNALGNPPKPTPAEQLQIWLKRQSEEEKKRYEVETLRGKLLEMDDEIEALKKYHKTKAKQLDEALADRDDSFKDLEDTLNRTRTFLEEKKKSLREIMKGVDKEMDEKIRQAQEEFEKTNSTVTKEKKGLMYWINKLLYGSRGEDDDFAAA